MKTSILRKGVYQGSRGRCIAVSEYFVRSCFPPVGRPGCVDDEIYRLWRSRRRRRVCRGGGESREGHFTCCLFLTNWVQLVSSISLFLLRQISVIRRLALTELRLEYES